MKKIIFIIIKILLIGTILISSYFIFKEKEEEIEQEQVFEELVEIVEDKEIELKDNGQEIESKVINLQNLYDINKDIIGWIKVGNTNINYPVMQSKIENYYLKKDFYKRYSYYGTPFLANNCDINTSENLIIYGHNMKNRKMFGDLENYKNKQFYDSNKVIDLYTLDNGETIKISYEIFAVFKTVAYSSTDFKYYQHVSFNSKESFEVFINHVQDLSLYKTEVNPKYGDKLITLSTCEYSNKNGRLVVVARKIE